MGFWESVVTLSTGSMIFFFIALIIAFGFEFINGFHDTANAVTTVIYTRTLKPTSAVVFSGFMNFLGVLTAGVGVAYGVVNLLPVDLLVDRAGSPAALVMVLALLIAGVSWNLGTWYLGLPVSSSHTLIGSILGVGLANSLYEGNGINGLNWTKAGETGMFLLISPLIGFIAAFVLLLALKRAVRDPRLYEPPQGDDRPPGWIRAALITTCGGVSFAHGSNDGQKGMGLLVLVLIGFMPFHYALNTENATLARSVTDALKTVREQTSVTIENEAILRDIAYLESALGKIDSFDQLPRDERWNVRQAIHRIARQLPNDEAIQGAKATLNQSVQFVPFWVKFGTALALGLGTMIGYKRIVVTVAERIGKSHLTYGQGAVAELVAAVTILAADVAHAPVSTTQILSSGVAGTMVANGSGVQSSTVRKILLAWCLTLPITTLLAAFLFTIGRKLIG